MLGDVGEAQNAVVVDSDIVQPALRSNDLNFIDQQSALSKLPTKEDIAYFCYFLASDKSSHITGQSFNLDSGVVPS